MLACFLRLSLLLFLVNGFLVVTYAETTTAPKDKITTVKKPVLQGNFAVIPLQNKTANAELDWLAIALQESLTIDLWYLPVGTTEALAQYSGILSKRCQRMTLVCVQQQTLQDWQGLAKEKGYTHLVWGSYQHDKNNQLSIQLQLVDAEQGEVLGTSSFSSDLNHITGHSGKALLALLATQHFSATTAEKKRVLHAETDQADALKAGYQLKQGHRS